MFIEFEGVPRLADGVTREAKCWERVLWGGYGHGNTGDYLTLALALRDARAGCGEAVGVLAPDRAELREVLPTARTAVYAKPRGLHRQLGTLALRNHCPRLGVLFYRWGTGACREYGSGAAWLRMLRHARSFHLVGGGYLTDRFDLEHFLCPLRVATALRLPVTTSPLGLGPFAGRKAAAKVADALRNAHVVVRDEASLAFCREHGLAVQEQPDDGFRLREVVPILPPEPAQGPDCRRLGICIFFQYEHGGLAALEAWWVACLRHLAGALPGWRFEGFCFHTQPQMDFETTRRVFSHAGLDPGAVMPPNPDFRAAIAGLRRFSAIVSTRFHAVVSALALNIPCVAIAPGDYYRIKMHSAISHSGKSIPLLNPLSCKPEEVSAHLLEVLGPLGETRL